MNEFALFATALSQEDRVPSPRGQRRLVEGGHSFTPSRRVIPGALHMAVSPRVVFELYGHSGHHTVFLRCLWCKRLFRVDLGESFDFLAR